MWSVLLESVLSFTRWYFAIQCNLEIFKCGLHVQILSRLLYVMKNKYIFQNILVFSVTTLTVYRSPFSGGFTFFELMKRGVPLHLIDKYMNESKTSEESEKKGSIWGLTHPTITQKSRSLLQIMCLNFGMVCCVQTWSDSSRKLCVCHRAIT